MLGSLGSTFTLGLNFTESKVLLLTTRQASKSRDEVLGQGIVTLLGKTADGEGRGLVSQRTILPKLEFRLLLC